MGPNAFNTYIYLADSSAAVENDYYPEVVEPTVRTSNINAPRGRPDGVFETEIVMPDQQTTPPKQPIVTAAAAANSEEKLKAFEKLADQLDFDSPDNQLLAAGDSDEREFEGAASKLTSIEQWRCGPLVGAFDSWSVHHPRAFATAFTNDVPWNGLRF